MGRRIRGGKCFCVIDYVPLPSQARFHRSAARFKGFSGPIGSGKSQALCQEAIKLSYLNAGRFGLVGAPTYPMLRDATQAALLEILEHNRLPYVLHKSENMLVMKDTGSKILFRSVDEYERLRGTNLAWFGLDELTYTAEEAWLRLEGRLRDPKARVLEGFAVWTPKGHDWVWRRFLDSPVNGYEAIIATPSENRHILDQVPDFYERLRHSYDERFFRQEVMGEYLSTDQGLVYHAFDRKVHVTPAEREPEKKLYWALDFNVDPMSSVVVQVEGTQIRVLDEIVIHRASTQDACEEFRRRYPDHEAGLVIVADASGAQTRTSGTTDHSIVQAYMAKHEYPKVTYRFGRRNPAVRERVALVNAKLKSAAGEVSLVVDPSCRELIKDFEEVCYQEGSSAINKTRDANRTHLSDALGYLIWEEFGMRRQFGEQRRTLF